MGCFLFPVVQDRVVFVWFWDKLAIAFGIITSTLRIGSVLNFLITSKVAIDYGLSWALWLGTWISSEMGVEKNSILCHEAGNKTIAIGIEFVKYCVKK